MEPSQRESHVLELCAGDSELIPEVRSLLESHAKMGEFLATSVFEERDEELLTGRRVGHYQLCEPIAEGGMERSTALFA